MPSSRRSPASSIPTPLESEQYGRQAHYNGNLKVGEPSPTLGPNGRINAAESLHDADGAVAASYSGFRITGIDASPHCSHTAFQDPVRSLTTLDASPIQPLVNRAAEGTHRNVGELINGRDEEHRVRRRESEAYSGASHSSHLINNEGLSVALVE